MLLLALAMSHALPAVQPQQRRYKARTVRVTRIPARAAPQVKIPIVAVDPGQRYRLPLPSTEVVDAKVDAVKSTGMACGTTGAPWCPRDGRQVLKTSLGDN
ncbi:hypothetical protein [Sphingomonas sp. KR3-1]|uniref:hypothetical protein n=1 Tax=Sphingomonas sp. KR3-1 TaxID=3156611 RepID=UPI0032B46264